MPERSLEFDRHAFDDLAWWIKQDRRKALRIVDIINDIGRSPFEGIGKPEPLKHNWAGKWSRRINAEHRVVYKVEDNTIKVYSLRYHYG